MLTAYERLLKKGLELQISDLHAQLPAGEIKGDVVLSLNKDMTFAQFIPLWQQPELILDIFSLQSEVSFYRLNSLAKTRCFYHRYIRECKPVYSLKTVTISPIRRRPETAKLYLNGLEFQFQ